MRLEGVPPMRGLVSGLSLLVVLWGLAGFVMEPRYGETDFFYGPDYRVRTVTEGGPADEAGIQVGDRMVSVDGVPVEDLPMQSRWRTRPVGATADIEVTRDGRPIATAVTFGGLPAERRIRSIRELIVNVAFLGFGLWAYLSVGTPLSLLLVGIGIARGLGSFPGPHLGPRFEGIGASIQWLGLVVTTFLLLRFFLEVPQRRRVVETGTADRVLWGALLLACGTCLAELVLHPALYMISGFVLLTLLLPVYLLLFAMVPWSWLKASKAERRGTGMSLMMLGCIVGLGPVILSLIMENVLGLTIPGRDFIPLVEVAIPLFLALGTIRHASPDGPLPVPPTLS